MAPIMPAALPSNDMLPSSHNTKIGVTTPPFPPKKKCRKGKWTSQEEEYAMLLIRDFKRGYLKVRPTGLTLRVYLAKKLQCEPMRITKKFAGDASIGKQAYRDVNVTISNKDAIRLAQDEVCISENKFSAQISEQLRQRPKKPSSARRVSLSSKETPKNPPYASSRSSSRIPSNAPRKSLTQQPPTAGHWTWTPNPPYCGPPQLFQRSVMPKFMPPMHANMAFTGSQSKCPIRRNASVVSHAPLLPKKRSSVPCLPCPKIMPVKRSTDSAKRARHSLVEPRMTAKSVNEPKAISTEPPRRQQEHFGMDELKVESLAPADSDCNLLLEFVTAVRARTVDAVADGGDCMGSLKDEEGKLISNPSSRYAVVVA